MYSDAEKSKVILETNRITIYIYSNKIQVGHLQIQNIEIIDERINKIEELMGKIQDVEEFGV